MLEGVERTLARFRVRMDRYFRESSLHERGRGGSRARPAGAQHVYEQEGAVWLRTTELRRRQGPRAAPLRPAT